MSLHFDLHSFTFGIHCLRRLECDLSSQGISRSYFRTSIQPGGYGRDVVSVYQIVAIQITVADIAFKISIAFSQSRIIGIRSQVVLINQTVIVDVPRQVAFRSGNLKYIKFFARTEIAHSFGNMQSDIACLGFSFKREHFHLTVAFPFKSSGFRPVLLIHAVSDTTFQQRTVSGIVTRHILQLVEPVDRVQVCNQIKRYSLLIICSVPQFSFLEVKQTAQRASLILR